MHRDYEIMIAFRQAIKRDCKGRSTLSTIDFVRELDRLNWSYTLHATRYTLHAANKWIETHTSTFRDISTLAGEERMFQVFNPNGGDCGSPWLTLIRFMPAVRQYLDQTCAENP